MFNRNAFVTLALALLCGLWGRAQPAVAEVGMNPAQAVWAFDVPLEKVSRPVTFFMRVQRQGNLSRFGTFDYYFRIRVVRPDGSEAWDTRYGFDETGYAEQVFTLPTLFWERSADRARPAFGVWKVRLAMVEKESLKEVSARQFDLTFTDGRVRNQLPGPALLEAGMKPEQASWLFDTPLEKVSKPVTFFMRVQRQGNLSRFGTFDYYYRIKVVRPDGTEVWNTRYGFDEAGYAEQVFTLPTLFWERSPDRSHPAFGIWRVVMALEEKDSQKAIAERAYNLKFADGRN